MLPNICDEFSENSVHGLHDLHDLPGIFSETLRIRSWTHGDLRDTDMCGGAMVPWCHGATRSMLRHTAGSTVVIHGSTKMDVSG